MLHDYSINESMHEEEPSSFDMNSSSYNENINTLEILPWQKKKKHEVAKNYKEIRRQQAPRRGERME